MNGVTGIQICQDGKLITFNMTGCIRIWITKILLVINN